MEKLKLPSMEYTFFLEVVGQDTGEKYHGDFTYVRPNIGMQIEIEKMAARYNGDLQNLDDSIRTINQIRATLFYCLKKFPDWWKESNVGALLYDGNIITDIFKKCNEFEKEWSKKVHGDIIEKDNNKS